MELREWIVTLHRKEDLNSFYEDMETPGGNLFIPDRAVDVEKRRTISRNTHYMLTYDEAQLLKADDRVWDVELAELVDITIKPMYKINQAEFSKSWFGDVNDVNWGLLRHSEELNRSNWGDDGTSQYVSDLSVTASGKHVDVVIVDGHIDPAHPEFAVNPDGSGGSRVNQYNWFQNNIGQGTGTYVYDRSGSYTNSADATDNDHGCHCAGTVAGNTQGWARDANIYNISPYSTNPSWGSVGYSSTTMWDYIRAWHNGKSINPVTGRKNPTVTNNSYGSSITPGQNGFGNITRINYRGTDFNPGRNLTVAELQDRGCYATAVNNFAFPNYFTSRVADLQDAIDDGIIIVVFAAGEAIQSSLHTAAGQLGSSRIDQRDNSYYLGKYQGTSMAGPQVAGVVAILAEAWPNMTQTEAHAWVVDNAVDGEMFDTGADDPMDLQSLQGAPNKILRWINQRSVSGNAFPPKNFRPRPSTGVTYPRPRIRKRG
jgi:hypothetical protein